MSRTKNDLKREADRNDGAIVLSERCWDGKRRNTVVITERGISYLERFVSSEMMFIVIDRNPELPRWACDYL